MPSLYLKNKLAILNFTSKYYRDTEEFVNGNDFKMFMNQFYKHLKDFDNAMYNWLKNRKVGPKELIRFSKLLCILDIKEIEEVKKNRDTYLKLTEEAYDYWRNLHRFSVLYTKHQEGLTTTNFMEADTKFNSTIIGFYRTIQEKLQGHRNYIYRQLQAGTNGSLLLSRELKIDIPGYEVLNRAYVIDKIMLRPPLIVHLDHNKRSGMFTETLENPLLNDIDYKHFMAFPCYVGDSKTIVYFHKDYLASAIGMANLYEYMDYTKIDKPDCILLFGVQDGKDETVFYDDKKNDIMIGKLSYAPIIEYFGYFKKMMLTLHNLRTIRKGQLPIHGAMLNIYLKNGQKKGICFMGDSGAGKSETLETLSTKFSDEIAYQEVIFDDMGTMYINDKGEVVCKGTETGAFTRLDDLDPGTAYKDIGRSIFFNPELSNSRVIIPVSTYKLITTEHKVDIFLYANNYEDKMGIDEMNDLKKIKEIYKEGKRYAIGTTSEKAISTTYFANPFGPMQKQKECDKIIDKVFKQLKENNILLGQLYTHLSLPNKEEGLMNAAEALINHMKK